jgi:Uma2 family endonuclease
MTSVMTLDAAALLPEHVRPLRRGEYERMVHLGLFGEEHVELLHGSLVEMSPQGPSHADITARLASRLTLAIGERALVRTHSALALTDDSEPEPDVAVVPLGRYAQEHPRTALLVVEVSDSSLRKDRGIKADLYAAAGIVEYWLVNLVDRVVEVHRAPVSGRYVDVVAYGIDARVAPSAFPEIVVQVGKLFGGE